MLMLMTREPFPNKYDKRQAMSRKYWRHDSPFIKWITAPLKVDKLDTRFLACAELYRLHCTPRVYGIGACADSESDSMSSHMGILC